MHVSKHGRPARTLWHIEQRFRQYTLLRVFPKTGKTHQIRVHLRSRWPLTPSITPPPQANPAPCFYPTSSATTAPPAVGSNAPSSHASPSTPTASPSSTPTAAQLFSNPRSLRTYEPPSTSSPGTDRADSLD
jgi:hypothetical protein